MKTPLELAAIVEDTILIVEGRRCVVCQKSGSGLARLADGRFVHRWPCRGRML